MVYQDSSLTPYHGSEPYIFISYSHRNADRASAIIRSLNRAGYRVWYDEGLIPGREWDENIARIIMGCGYFIALITREYLASSNCKDELNYARDKNKPILLIYLDEVALPAGMELRLGRLFAVHYSQYSTTEEFYLKVFSADGLARCNRRSVPPVSGTASNARGTSNSRASSASRSSSAAASGKTVQNERTREAPASPRAKAEPSSSGSGLKAFGALLILALLIGIGYLLYYYYSESVSPAPAVPPAPPIQSVAPTVSTEAELDIETTPIPSIEPSPSAEPASTPTPELTPAPISTPTPTPVVTPEPTPSPTPTPIPTPIPTPEMIPTAEPQLVDPTPTPEIGSVVIVESGGTSDNTVTVVPSP